MFVDLALIVAVYSCVRLLVEGISRIPARGMVENIVAGMVAAACAGGMLVIVALTVDLVLTAADAQDELSGLFNG